jgi:hypothetical protein
MNSARSVAQGLIGQQNRSHTNLTILSRTNRLKFSPLPKGGRRFLPKTTSRKRQKFQFEHPKVLMRWRVSGKAYSATIPQLVRQIQYAKFTSQVSKIQVAGMLIKFQPSITRLIKSRVPGQSFVPKGSQSFASDRVHQATFVPRCFANRGSRDSLINGVVACLRRPISKGSIRP